MNPTALVLLDYFGIAVFAVSGALLAAEKKQTLVTFIFFAVVTGVGGGTLRDLLIGAPVFWVHTNATLADLHRRRARRVARPAGAGSPGRRCCGSMPPALPPTRLTARPRRSAIGVAPVPAFAMGVLTACVGGIIRDVLAGEPSILMRPELYVTAAALAAGLFVGLALLGVAVWIAAAIAIVAGFALRGARHRARLVIAGLSRLGSAPMRDRSLLLSFWLAACATVPARDRPVARASRRRLRPQWRDRELRRRHRRSAVRPPRHAPTIPSASPRSARWSSRSAS